MPETTYCSLIDERSVLKSDTYTIFESGLEQCLTDISGGKLNNSSLSHYHLFTHNNEILQVLQTWLIILVKQVVTSANMLYFTL